MVRHHLVQRIIRAYDEHKTRAAEEQIPLLEAKSITNGKTTGAEVASPEKLPVSCVLFEHCDCCAITKWWPGFVSTVPSFGEMKM